MPRGIYKRAKGRNLTTRHLAHGSPLAPRMRNQAHETPVAAVAVLPEPTQKTLRLMDAVRLPFLTYVENLTLVNQSRAELAKPFNAAYEAWAADTNGQFVQFVRALDPTVPMDRADYRNYPAYTSAQNLRRLATAGTRPAVSKKNKPVTPLIALARFLATVLPMFGDATEQALVWGSFVKQMHWSETQVARLQTIVNKEGPITIEPATGKRSTTPVITPALRAPLTLTRRTGTSG